jgi:hypothetical protein
LETFAEHSAPVKKGVDLVTKGTHGERKGAGLELDGDVWVEAGAGFRIISSTCVIAAGLSLSAFKATAASPRVASFRKVEFAGEGLRSALAIEDSKAFAASSVLPESSEARP